jgi:hypothetical protein
LGLSIAIDVRHDNGGVKLRVRSDLICPLQYRWSLKLRKKSDVGFAAVGFVHYTLAKAANDLQDILTCSGLSQNASFRTLRNGNGGALTPVINGRFFCTFARYCTRELEKTRNSAHAVDKKIAHVKFSVHRVQFILHNAI